MGNVSWDLQKMSTIEKCPLQSVRYMKGCYESLTIITSFPEKGVRCREASTIKDVRYQEVSMLGHNWLLAISFVVVTKIIR